MRPQTMLNPLTGVIDATTPDSETGRRFSLMVRQFLADAPRYQLYRAELSLMLSDWQTSGAQLNAVIERSPALMEIKPLATAQNGWENFLRLRGRENKFYVLGRFFEGL